MRRMRHSRIVVEVTTAGAWFARLVLTSVITIGLSQMFAIPFATKAQAKTSSGEQALQTLLAGNKHYVSNKTVCPNPAHRPSDAKQKPIATVLSCSDSRVPADILFDQGVGSIFVVREAGNTYNRLGFESIEYAVTQLRTPLILVMGHDTCGAVTAAVDSYPKQNVGPLRENIYPGVRKALELPHDNKDELISNAVDQNAIAIARKLAATPMFKKLIKSGELEIVAARYKLATGAVAILERETASQ